MIPQKPFLRYREIIDDYEAFCDSLRHPLPVTLWANPDRVTAAELHNQLAQIDGFAPEPIPWYPGGFQLAADCRAGKRWEFFSGLCQIQEKAAMLPVLMLAPQPGECVLDLCAAPGNKTAQIAFAMHNRGTLVANDINRKRLPALRQTCERLGVRNVTVVNHDGANIAGHAARFDRILVDAPCSCEGTTRRNPGQPLESEPHFSEKRQGAQIALLHKAVQLCRAGGRIVYSTCTYAPEENEAVIDAVLSAYGHENLHLIEPSAALSLTASPGVTHWNGQVFHPDIKCCLRLWPHQNDTGGFFIAVLEKTGERLAKNAQPVQEKTAVLAEADQGPLLEAMARFGIPPSRTAGLKPVWGRDSQLFLMADDHRLPAWFAKGDTGLRSLRPDSQIPKPTHPGALFLGAAATRNIVNLSESRLALFMRRQAIDLEPSELIECDGSGFVIVKTGKSACGLGILCANNEGGFYLVSNYPRRWSARLF